MADQPPRKPRDGTLKVIDYRAVAEFFASRHRLAADDIERFWDWIEPIDPLLTKYVVVDVMDALLRGGEGVARFAGLLQKEYRDQFIVLDIRSKSFV